jgi:hypothetical protein
MTQYRPAFRTESTEQLVGARFPKGKDDSPVAGSPETRNQRSGVGVV